MVELTARSDVRKRDDALVEWPVPLPGWTKLNCHRIRSAADLPAPEEGFRTMPMVGPYVLSGEPLVGGYARLFKAVHQDRVDQILAVKLFDPPKRVESRVLQASWTNELETYQRLGASPYLVTLHDWGRADDGSPYLVFEWLDGDLMDHVTSHPLEGWDDFWPIARDILSGLALIHSAGYVHRDLKPENVLLSPDGSFKVADFGTTRLAEAMRMGVTMALLGTAPYAPPERGTPGPSPAYDLYSFGVIVIVCLTGAVSSDAEVGDQFDSLDLPPDIRAILAPCLTHDVSGRPESASLLLAKLREVQEARERRRAPSTDIHLVFPPSTLEQAARLLHLPVSGIRDYLLDDLQAVGAFNYDLRSERPALQACGQTLVFRLQVEGSNPSVVGVQRVLRASSQTLDMAHASWFRPNLRFRVTAPVNPALAAQKLSAFLLAVSEHEAERSAEQAASQTASAFAGWRSILQAKFALEDERAAPIRYSSWHRQGARVRFNVGDLPNVTVGENRLVVRGRQKVLFGEVEQLDNGELVLYVTRGDPSDLPKGGRLDFDAEASKSKLRREQSALDRLVAGNVMRPRLRELLLEPEIASAPTPVEISSFIQPNLDEPKKLAVASALGAQDILLVQGPPGTGKTTFIAELVAQQLARSPESRILLTAQTHVAVDHALAGIARLSPAASIVRLGRQDQIAETVEEFGLTARLEATRGAIVEAGRTFLRQLAHELGLDVDTVDVEALAAELEVKAQRLTRLRSRLALKREERTTLSAKLAENRGVAARVLAVAEVLERAVAAASTSEMVEAAKVFLDTGVELASGLEAGGSVGEKLVATEQLLKSLSEDVAKEAAEVADVRRRLAPLVDADPGASSKELLAAVNHRSPATDSPVYNRLTELSVEWAERFGKGSEFNAVVIAGSSVIGATCVGLTGVRGAETVDFDLCIVDEASKATSTETLVPMVQGRRWVLVGDEKQLPPFVEEALNDRAFLQRFGLSSSDVRQTLFAELAEGLPEHSVVTLTHQHRMHPAIGDLISRCFYSDKLTSSDREIDSRVGLALGLPVTWVDTSGRPDRHEVRNGSSYLNPCETRVAGNLLKRLNFVSSKSDSRLKVAVLTGYDPQRREILDFVHRHEGELTSLDVHVANVDAYQGQEADVAMFLVTRSNAAGELGFLKQEPRINVALSRARDGLVIIGDASFIRSASSARNPLGEVLRYVEAHPLTCGLKKEGEA